MGAGFDTYDLITAAHSTLGLLLAVTASAGFAVLAGVTSPGYLARPVRSTACVAAETYRSTTGILAGFPFAHAIMRLCLGPSDPSSIYVEMEPLPLTRTRVSRVYRYYYRRHRHNRTVDRTSLPGFYPNGPPRYRKAFEGLPGVSVPGLVPSIFGAPALDD